jgi:molecular chaperone DnaK
MSKTIQIGIDLGTTNSAVAVNHNNKIEIVKNSDQMDYTPSVFGYNKWKNIQIGKKAYEQLFHFADMENIHNYKSEVKRLMGTNDKISFDRMWIELSPEEISSEILKYLKESVLRKYPDINHIAAVITVPAYFDTIQKEATKNAWELAWFKYVILVQEPIAWAVAYWFENKNNENRLVYDLGWWTFDVAVVSSKDNVLTIKWHAWDNFLWWKDFDNIIIEKVIVPYLIKEHGFNKKDIENNSVYNILKYYAESAKKELTDSDSTTIVIDSSLVLDENAEQIYAEVPFSRLSFEELIDSLVGKSIELAKKAIKESWLTEKSIHKIVLVWGPTQIPYIRRKLEADLWISVDVSMDPLTVVAKGAAIFWSSQVIPSEVIEKKNADKIWTVAIDLRYESAVSDTDTMISGKIDWLEEGSDYYVQIQSEDEKYSSSKIKIKNGKFFDTVLVEENKTNIYYIYLTDADGNIIPTDPDHFIITHGLSIAGTPLSHNISVALHTRSLMSDESWEYCEVIFERWSILPLKKTLTYRTTRKLKKWDDVNTLPIKIYEWESKKPDRNKQILEVKLMWLDIPYDLPESTEVNLTVEMDASGTVSLSVYIPSIDIFKKGNSLRTQWEQDEMTSEEIQEELEKEQKRLESIAAHISETQKKEMQDNINEIMSKTNRKDTDTQKKNHSQLRELKHNMDKCELETMSSRLISTFKDILAETEKYITEQNNPLEYKQLESLKADWEKAIGSKDWERLDIVNTSIQALNDSLFFNSPEGLKQAIAFFYQHKHEATDIDKVDQIFVQAAEYIQSNNVDGMKASLKELFIYFPQSSQASLWRNISGITK